MPERPETGRPRSSRPASARSTFFTALAACLAIACLPIVSALPLRGDEEERRFYADPHRGGPVTPAEDLDGLRRHFRAPDGAELGDADSERIYAGLKRELARRYAVAERASVARYQQWPRYNRVPYLSAAHGNRYVNNYANARAGAYGRFEEAGRMPVGAVLAKDTFTVNEDGTVLPGALLVMEKMPEGFNYVSGDWRYFAVMPDGSILGETGGPEAESVEFCVACHLAVEHQDHMHLVPEEYRRR